MQWPTSLLLHAKDHRWRMTEMSLTGSIWQLKHSGKEDEEEPAGPSRQATGHATSAGSNHQTKLFSLCLSLQVIIVHRRGICVEGKEVRLRRAFIEPYVHIS